MGREQDRSALLFQFEDHVLEHVRIDGIESGERLVHDDQLGLVQQRGDELDLLLHALRHFLDALVDPFRDVEPLRPFARPRDRVARGQAAELSEQGEVFAHGDFSIEPAFFGQVSYLMQMAALEGLAEQPHRAGVGP